MIKYGSDMGANKMFLSTPLNFYYSDDDHKEKFKSLYKVNSLGFRGDELIPKTDKTRILFSGCSVTFGQGLYDNFDLWSNRLYHKLSKHFDTDGYFNIAIPGNNILGIIFNLFKYFDKYGNPDYIFLFFPEINRSFYKNESDYHLVLLEDKDKNLVEINKMLCYQYYFMLKVYCDKNNINLFVSGWDKSENYNDFVDIGNFYVFDTSKVENMILEIIKKDIDNPHIAVAADGHPGIAYNNVLCNFLYARFLERLEQQ